MRYKKNVNECFHFHLLFIQNKKKIGDLVPAKAIPSKSTAYVSFGGEEIPKQDYHVSEHKIWHLYLEMTFIAIGIDFVRRWINLG